MKNLLFLIAFSITRTSSFSQSPQVDWLQQFGTGSDEASFEIHSDFQGNYITSTLFKGSTTIAGQTFQGLGISDSWDFIITKFDQNQSALCTNIYIVQPEF